MGLRVFPVAVVVLVVVALTRGRLELVVAVVLEVVAMLIRCTDASRRLTGIGVVAPAVAVAVAIAVTDDGTGCSLSLACSSGLVKLVFLGKGAKIPLDIRIGLGAWRTMD